MPISLLSTIPSSSQSIIYMCFYISACSLSSFYPSLREFIAISRTVVTAWRQGRFRQNCRKSPSLDKRLRKVSSKFHPYLRQFVDMTASNVDGSIRRIVLFDILTTVLRICPYSLRKQCEIAIFDWDGYIKMIVIFYPGRITKIFMLS
jgi:hypothetical protein